MSDPGTTYRNRDEIASMRTARDPIELVKNLLVDNNLAEAQELKEIEKSIRKQVQVTSYLLVWLFYFIFSFLAIPLTQYFRKTGWRYRKAGGNGVVGAIGSGSCSEFSSRVGPSGVVSPRRLTSNWMYTRRSAIHLAASQE